MLELDIAPVVPDMAEVVEPPVAAQDSLASAQRTHCSVEPEDCLFPPVVASRPLAGEEHTVSKPGETTVPLMNKQARHSSHAHDA